MTRQLPWYPALASYTIPKILLLILAMLGGSSLFAQLQVSFETTEPVCFSLPNGSITATASGGLAPYIYQWSTGDSGPTITGVSSGTYTVTVTDATSNQAVQSVFLDQPDLVTVDIVATDPCTSPATLTAVPDGGVPGYSYNWSTGAMTQSINNALSGTQYCVTVTDENNCGAVDCFTPEFNPPSVSVNTDVTTCPGGNDGTLTATPFGGTPPFVYTWSNGAFGQTINNLTAGNYTVTLTDALGCTATVTGTVFEPQGINITLSPNNPICSDDTNGSVSSIVTGGTAPYTYIWSTGASTTAIFNLGPGTYTLTIIDANGCVETASTTLINVSNLIVGGVGTPETCPDANDGFATVSPTGGVMPYTYVWNVPGETDQVIENAAPGVYSVTVTDAVGCSASTNIVVPEAPAFTVVANGSNPTTCGVNNGTATAVVLQGGGPFTFLWNTGATSQTISGLGAGTYFVTVTNGDECVTTAVTTLIAPPDVFVTATATSILCPGDNSGTATANVTGGTAPFSFTWSNGGNTQTIGGLIAGTYTVTVTDANNCTDIDQVSIAQAPPVTFLLTGTETVCGEGSTGTATATPTGGTGPFSFQWSTGATSSTVTGLTEGQVSVTVTDVLGCSSTQSIFINIIDDLDVQTAATPADCPNEASGSAVANASGGDAPYTYAWSNGATGQTNLNLLPGTYAVTVTDANGCTAEGSATVVAPAPITIELTQVNPIVCEGEANGFLNAMPAGGTPPYSFQWNTGATSSAINNLGPGTYIVIVTDANGCSNTTAATITENPVINVEVTGQTVICGQPNSGTASAFATGGTGIFTYEWNTGATTQTITGLASGTYMVTATDQLGCEETGAITIEVVSDLEVNVIPRDVLCFGDNSGSALAFATGGSTPYTFTWSTGATGNEVLNLVAGTYSVTVTEGNGCTASATFTIDQPTQLTAVATGTDPLCPGDENGTAAVTALGGTAPYSYAWSNGDNGANLIGLSAGTYTVTVTDDNLCTTTASVTLTDPPALNVNVIAPTITCGGTASGTASAIVVGGTGNYTYMWSDGQTTATATNLLAGTYSLTVTDENGCAEEVTTIIVDELPEINVDFNVTNIECSSAPVGAITAVASNGLAPYTFLWNTGATTATITGLTAGTYTVTVTDANNCQVVRSTEVQQTEGFTLVLNDTDVTCFGFNNGTASVIVNGGQEPFVYDWSNGMTTASISGLAPGTYTVNVIDANECSASGTVVITEPTALVVSTTSNNLNCAGDMNGEANANASGGTAPYTYQWNTGQTTSTIANQPGGFYMVTVTDANGCTATGMTTIEEPTLLTVIVSQNSGTCSNENEGILVATVTGGTPAYTYLWDDGQTTATASGLTPGLHSVTVTDANGCIMVATASVTLFPAPSCMIEVVQPSMMGNDGILTVNVDGGTAPFTYLWSNGETTETISNLPAGGYSVTVTDANGCQTACFNSLESLAGIGNYVWEDIDHDGQQDADEPAVPGVTVNLKDENGNVIASTVTDADGAYIFLGLTPGTYSVQFVIPDGFDYTSSNQGDDELDNDIIPGMNGMTGTYVLEAGEINLTVDGGIYVPPNGIINDPCGCLDNATSEDNGQFTETFTIRSYPGETWTVIAGENMFSPLSPAPPAAPIPLTFPFDAEETAEPGTYEFTFYLVDELTYSVTTTNGFDTLSISNTCVYPTLNVEELPPIELCLAESPIELEANPNIPGNVVFTINGIPNTTIDPLALGTGSYELVASLVPVDPEECAARIVTQFEINDECLATVGNQVWLDLNCDGIQGGNEPGVPGVEVTITGTAEFNDPNVNLTTFTDAQGNFEFMVPPGNYKLTFGTVPGYEVTAPNQGSNDELDSDVNPFTMMTEFFNLAPDEVNLSYDLGFCPECINITHPGAIGFDQYLCAPGNDPEPFVSLAEPTGGSGPIEYLWMYTNGLPGTPIQYWTPIPNSNSPTYDAGPLFETTYFARCARVEDCGPYLEANILVVEVGDETTAIINGPGLVCYNQPTTFTAEDVEPGSTVVWNFGPDATPSTVVGPVATVTYTNVNTYEVELMVTLDGCTATEIKTVVISTLPTVCGDGLLIDTDITDMERGEVMVSWEMSAITPGMDYHVEHSVDGENFERVATINTPAEQRNGVLYYEYDAASTKRGINYYRVILEDLNGNTAESNIEEVIFFTDSKIAMLYPNPVEDVLNMEIFETFGEQEAVVEIFSVSGKLMATIGVETDQRQMQIDFNRFPAGAYLVRLRLGDTNIRTMKVIKR